MLLHIPQVQRAKAQEGQFSVVVCMECHADRDLTGVDRKGNEISMFVDLRVFRTSVHRNMKCTSCHGGIDEIPHDEELPLVRCGACHDAENRDYLEGRHGAAFERGDPDAPACWDCHGKHDILPAQHPSSQVARANLTRVCLRCHVDEEITARHEEMPAPQTIKAYEKSVHGKGYFEKGLTVVAECVDCHSGHLTLPASDPRSRLYKVNVPETCGSCHRQIQQEYERSVHGEALRSGVLEAPACTDCHGEHDILPPSEEMSRVSPKNIPKTCSSCHDDVALAEKYQLPINRYRTYLESFHGVALKYGKTVVANCASCHGVHDILPSSDPRSKIHPDNRQKTCGQCHPGIGIKAALGKVHIEASPASSKGKYFVRKFYTWFISILMTLFVLYILIEMIGRIRHRRARGAAS
jgi:nitrate/TMAO reductase-like tetraheme cytochrome c subunit